MSLGKSLSTTTSSSSFNFVLNHNHTLISSKSPLTVNYPHNLPNNVLLSLSSRSHSLTPISCKSSLGPGDGDSRTVLDAFFLGKALGEALTERVESVVGEVLSTVGRLQAEQQKQIQEFQEEVLERAKAAQEKAAREALQVQSTLPPNPIAGTKDVTVASSTSAVLSTNGFGTSSVSAITIETDSPTSVVEDDEEGEDHDSISSVPIDE
ncbi:hypothetical protein RND81_05G218600 [Saponaria officinalis]|uniref:Uncharacterized protein n=1 Tax=Saponaria officinalis TaxID=3572 RepID=A0AAW1L300_SAPOF